MFWLFSGFSDFAQAGEAGGAGGAKRVVFYRPCLKNIGKMVDKANLRAYTCKKAKTKLTKEGRNKSMAQLHAAMNYTFYFYFRGFTFSAGYFTCANPSDSMSFCMKKAA